MPQRKAECHVLSINLLFFFFSYNSFSSLFSPSTFFCTVIADAFDKLFADPKPKAQMKAIFLQAICQRKSQAKNFAVAKASSPLSSR